MERVITYIFCIASGQEALAGGSSRKAFRLRAGLNSPLGVGLCHDICKRGNTGRCPREA